MWEGEEYLESIRELLCKSEYMRTILLILFFRFLRHFLIAYIWINLGFAAENVLLELLHL